jgi:hypothetical protein
LEFWWNKTGENFDITEFSEPFWGLAMAFAASVAAKGLGHNALLTAKGRTSSVQ